MKQFKYGDVVKVVSPYYEPLNGLAGVYIGELQFYGHSVLIPKLGNIVVHDVEPIGNTLLEILVDELPKRGGWRDGASVCVQDEEKEIKFNSELRNISFGANKLRPTRWTSSGDESSNFGWIRYPIDDVDQLATDYATKIVTREEYERAVAINASGDNKAMPKKTFHANNWMITVAGENATLAQKQLEDSIMKGRFTVEVDCTLGALPVPTSKAAALDNMLKKNGISDDEAVKACAEAEAAELRAKKRIENSGYLPELDRIRKLRDERDLAEKKYSSQFVSGEIEIRKLNLGDKIIFERDSLGIVMEVTKVVRGIFEHECHLQGLPPHAAFVSVLTIHDVSRFAKVS
ncbi:MAG: hypothetical protein ACRDCI_11760 [Plesiomonas shigelloides]